MKKKGEQYDLRYLGKKKEFGNNLVVQFVMIKFILKNGEEIYMCYFNIF